MNVTQAVLLAAGESSRFWPLSVERHKSELVFLGQSLINRTVHALAEAGVNNIIIVHSEHHSLSIDTIDGVEISFVPLDKPEGMGYALLAARQLLNEQFLVLHPYHFDGVSYLAKMVQAEYDGGLLLAIPQLKKNGGYATVRDGAVTSIAEKTYEGEENQYYVQGMYVLSRNYITILEQEPHHHYSFESALNRYVGEKRVGATIIDEPLISVKYPWNVFDVRDYLIADIKRQIHPSAEIHATAVIEGSVVVEEGAQIGAYAVIRGPVYIGRRVFVGDHTLIRDKTILEEGVLVGAMAEVKNAIVMEQSRIQGYVADSIIGRSVKIAHGFTTGNRRIDRKTIHAYVKGERIDTNRTEFGTVVGDNAAFGISVCTMPGVLIGSGAIVGPATVVFENVANKMRVYERVKPVQKNEEHTLI